MKEFIRKHSLEIILIIIILSFVLSAFMAWKVMNMQNKLLEIESRLDHNSDNNHADITSYDIDEILSNVRETNEKINDISEIVNDIDF